MELNEHELYAVIAERLREARKENGLTQDTAAMAVGVMRTTLVNIERGYQTLKIPQLYKLCALYGIKPQDVLPDIEHIVTVSIDAKQMQERLKEIEREAERIKRILISSNGHEKHER